MNKAEYNVLLLKKLNQYQMIMYVHSCSWNFVTYGQIEEMGRLKNFDRSCVSWIIKYYPSIAARCLGSRLTPKDVAKLKGNGYKVRDNEEA